VNTTIKLKGAIIMGKLKMEEEIETMFDDFYTAYKWLYDHPMFQKEIKFEGETWNESHFRECLDIDVVKINPEKEEIDKDESKNTQVEIWLECGEYHPKHRVHDVELDCGGFTFEEAIINLANLVMEWYGETKDRIKKSDWKI